MIIRDPAFSCMLPVLRGAFRRLEAESGRELLPAGKLVAHSRRRGGSAACPTFVAFAALHLDGSVLTVTTSSLRKPPALTQEEFDSLLSFLGRNPEEAGQKYEEIRRRLIKIFGSRGCPNPEELVDECMDRVARKAAELARTYEGDPALFFYGVARLVFLEWAKQKPASPPPPNPDPSEDDQRGLDCLEECLESLPPAQSAIIRDYYQHEKSAKIEHRRALAARMGIGVNALRIRAHRIRAELQKCVIDCVQRAHEGALSS